MPVVVGFIASKEGRAALRHAIREAKLRDTRLVLIHSERGGHEDDVVGLETALGAAERAIEEAGIAHEMRQLVRGNDPAEDLVDIADEVGAHCIVIGLRRRTPVGKLLLGSNAQRILLDASCPVIAVKADWTG
ncbi:MAG: universal stress protein [Austwickia sp.]|jgi:nucleotide-binding universal stress UspA family protein|nr:universal stress protein [Austwickia sp.]MBK8435318.1 universal stress protein [Austwickia sp.]MBK9101133.1 universal stress protein [Austwickia sp.]